MARKVYITADTTLVEATLDNLAERIQSGDAAALGVAERLLAVQYKVRLQSPVKVRDDELRCPVVFTDEAAALLAEIGIET